jgi:hypothetical protein
MAVDLQACFWWKQQEPRGGLILSVRLVHCGKSHSFCSTWKRCFASEDTVAGKSGDAKPVSIKEAGSEITCAWFIQPGPAFPAIRLVGKLGVVRRFFLPKVEVVG